MIIRGRFIGDAPHFAVHIRSARFQGLVCTKLESFDSRGDKGMKERQKICYKWQVFRSNIEKPS